MKYSILIPVLSLMLLGAVGASAQDKDKSENKECKHHSGCCHEGWGWRNHEFCHSDFDCYRAWKKDMKREKKECLAAELECYRPYAAERKKRKAMKKSWKRDVLADQHEHWGWGHDYWY
jgi:hypothetical protein